jgi:hypothetical protein
MSFNQIALLKDVHPDELGMIPNFIDQDDPRHRRHLQHQGRFLRSRPAGLAP